MEARVGLLPFWCGEMEAEVEARFGLLPFWSGEMEAEVEAKSGLLPFCFHFSRAARLKTVDVDTPKVVAIDRRVSPPDS